METSNYILWIGGVYSEDSINRGFQISPAANKWQKGLVNSIIEDIGMPVVLISHLPERIWPFGKLLPCLKNKVQFYFGNNFFVEYLNLPCIRTASLTISYKRKLKLVIEQRGKPVVIISYNPTKENVATGLLAQTKYQIPWIDLCADSYDPKEDWSGYAKGASRAKGHIFLSYHAFTKSPFQKKLHLDGGINSLKFNSEILFKKESKEKKIILYSGMMSIWGGISFLLKAFEKICIPDVELWICGHGNNSDLNIALKRDSRIKYFGFVSDSQLQEMCQQASIFVNPRPSNVNGNNMNFPSKILEFLSYGKPVVSTWTPGLSPEYREVLEVLNEETENCLYETIEKVLCWDDEKIKNNALRIKSFLLGKKLWSHQSKRMMNWLKEEII